MKVYNLKLSTQVDPGKLSLLSGFRIIVDALVFKTSS